MFNGVEHLLRQIDDGVVARHVDMDISVALGWPTVRVDRHLLAATSISDFFVSTMMQLVAHAYRAVGVCCTIDHYRQA